tara:strand:+ start:113 stop:571 length:459 start_codon:yes stop_codon:yes gene_type:complete
MTSIEGFEHYIIFEDGKIMNQYGKELKPCKNKKGYIQLVLSKNKKQKNFSLHRLLALTFIPNPDNLPEVDHIDRDRSNNDLENLHWVTSLENCQNKGEFKSNTSGIKNIAKYKGGWIFRKQINKKIYQKISLDKQIVIDYKKNLFLELNILE